MLTMVKKNKKYKLCLEYELIYGDQQHANLLKEVLSNKCSVSEKLDYGAHLSIRLFQAR